MFEINGTKIGSGQKPYIIAELSANHGGNIDIAKKSIEAASKTGANAVKLQTYTPDTITINSDRDEFQIKSGLWKGRNLYDLYAEAHTPFEWHEELFDVAKKCGITIFSSPFDFSAVDLLESLNAPAYKIASFELIDIPLIKRVASCGKPMFMSTGMATLSEISEAVEAAKGEGNKNILLFHCISSYPAPLDSSNLKNIQELARNFKVEVGLSDHTLTNFASCLSIALGGCAIEKHFKYNDEIEGPDSSFSLGPEEFSSLVEDCNLTYKALGTDQFQRSASEKNSQKHRRSLYFVKKLRAGETITSAHVKSIRPGNGIAPKHLPKVVGRSVTCDVEFGTPVSWGLLRT